MEESLPSDLSIDLDH